MHTVIILSGGLDSTTLLYQLLAAGDRAVPLGIDYGQRHRRELAAARALCQDLGLDYTVADLRALRRLLPGSSQTDDTVAVPEGHYTDASMRHTVVPNRNMLLLAVALGVAVAAGADRVAYAAHAGDHPIYPDCRPAFVAAMQQAAAVCSERRLDLYTPFLHWTKADIVRQGAALGVPFGRTWSCYQGGERHCGRCGTCVERREAFDLAGMADPTEYAHALYPQENRAL